MHSHERRWAESHGGLGLFDAIDALQAHDDGATDSGIKDERMRAAVVAHLLSLDPADRRRTLAELARRSLTDGMIAQGYGLEDVVAFANWLVELGVPLG